MRKQNIFWGVLLIAFAVLIILGQVGIHLGSIVWPIIFTVLFGYCFFASLASWSLSGMIFSIALLVYVWSETWHLNFSLIVLLIVAALLSAGLEMIFGQKLREMRPKKYMSGATFEDGSSVNPEGSYGGNGSTSSSHTGSQIRLKRNFTGSCEYIRSADMKYVEVSANFSGVKVYFDQTQIQGEFAKILVFSRFSGVELYIPSDWKVNLGVENTFGDTTIDPDPGKEKTKTIDILGNNRFGSVEVHYI